jgi:hypothetical protein
MAGTSTILPSVQADKSPINGGNWLVRDVSQRQRCQYFRIITLVVVQSHNDATVDDHHFRQGLSACEGDYA